MKNKYIIFTAQGARIVKGYSIGGIPVPKELPTHIPMKHWKHEKGQIVEMNSKEKRKIDKAINKSMSKRPRIKLRKTQYFLMFIIALLTNFLIIYIREQGIIQKITHLLNN